MKRFFSLTALLSLAVHLIHAGSCVDNWPSAYHDSNNSASNPCETILNPGNVAGLTLKATTNAPGGAPVYATPVVYNNIVYYGDGAGNFFARNAADLSLVTSTNLSGSIFSPALVTADTIYVIVSSSSGEIRLYALDFTLTPKAAFNGGFVVVDPSTNTTHSTTFGGPVVVDNIVMVPICGNDQETNIFPTNRGGLFAFDATTGATLWQTIFSQPPCGFQGGSFSTTSIDCKLKLAFIGTTDAVTQPAGPNTDALLAIDYRTGKIKWSRQYTKGDVWGALYPEGPDQDVGAGPNLFTIERHGKKIAVVGAASKRGIYRVFERETGKEIWHTCLIPGKTPVATTAPGAAYSNGTIYAPCLFDTSGRPQGVLTILGLNGNAAASAEFFAAYLSTIYTNIVALDACSGKIKWTDTSLSVTSGTITEANGVIYHNNWLGELRLLDAATGAVIKVFTAADFAPGALLLPAPVVVTGGRVFLSVGFLGSPFPTGIAMLSL